jgi:N-acetyl-anhydromuramyl-L-alanine amidase AmpD
MAVFNTIFEPFGPLLGFVKGTMSQPQSLLLTMLSCSLITGCSGVPIVSAPSENFNSRVNHLVIHFTSEDFARSMAILTGETERRVSAHYVIPQFGDLTYAEDKLRVYELVSTSDRAWHAGRSYWRGKTGLNDQSIGVEIVNQSGCNEDIATLGNSTEFATACAFKPFGSEQIDLLVRLLNQTLEQHPDIRPEAIVGHADIAPTRKVDPGPLFPWKQLFDAGIGAWFDESRVIELVSLMSQHPLTIEQQQALLLAYGYKVTITGAEDEQSQLAVRAFQMHFRPANYSGFFDDESAAILISLLERYRPRSLDALVGFPPELGRSN